MKKILLALLLTCGVAHSEEYWVAQTEAGGEIILTFTRTENCGDQLFFMYVQTKLQEVIYGCWTAFNDRIHVRFDDNTRRVYDATGWTKRGGK